jgi:uncharacterized protein (DUF697 family)/tellurite resistance protein
MTDREQQAILTLCLMAAFADGAKAESERAQIKRIAETLAPDGKLDLAALYRDVLLQRRSPEDAAAALGTPALRNLAYEMAVCVCDADGAAGPAEQAFLERLRTALQIEPQAAQRFDEQAAAVAGAPLLHGEVLPPESVSADTGPAAPSAAVDAAALDKMILNYAILNGALELLPQSIASMAIIPLQMKMVYRVGKSYGYELDRGHIKDLLATLGVGLTGQYVEQIGRKLIGGLLGKAAGGLLGGLGSVATGSAFSFATTYALGAVARQYYASGRTLDAASLKQVFASMLQEAKGLQGRYAAQIEDKARTIDVGQIASLVRGQ